MPRLAAPPFVKRRREYKADAECSQGKNELLPGLVHKPSPKIYYTTTDRHVSKV